MKIKIILLIAPFFIFYSCKDDNVKVQPPQPFEVYEIKPQTALIYEEFVGQVYGEKDIPIRARVEGFLVKIYFKEGGRVKKGQLLYSIDPDPFQEAVAAQKSMVSQAQTVVVQTESDLRRIKPLAEMDAVSMRELDMAQAQRDAALSSLDAAKANLKIAEINLGYTKLYAPINGIIGKTLAREGEFVGKDPNPVILNTVSKINTVRVQFFLSENQYLKIARDFIKKYNKKIQTQGTNINLELILADESLYEHKGVIDFIDRNVDSSTGAILLQATFPNPDGLIRPGQFARVKAMVKEEKDALLVPQKCVSELQGQYSVFIVNSENMIESKQVKVGEKIGEFLVIKDGLNDGDKVILEGVQKVRSGMEVVPEITEFKSQLNSQE